MRDHHAHTGRTWILAAAVAALALHAGASVACTSDPDCDDGVVCNGQETCNLATLTCVPGTPPDCSALTGPCGVGICTEPDGCTVNAVPNGNPCEDGDLCTQNDECIEGVCTGTPEIDSDGDSFCDAQELLFGCDALNPAVIPPQPAVYSGGRFGTRAETLLTYALPLGRNVVIPEDPICAENGVCGTDGYCTVGKIGDACTQDTDCDQPPYTCRIVMNQGASPDLTVIKSLVRPMLTEIGHLILPFAPGCARRFDVTLPMFPDRRRGVLVLRVSGTTDGKVRRDRDTIRFFRERPPFLR
jgi:hypothetical protein